MHRRCNQCRKLKEMPEGSTICKICLHKNSLHGPKQPHSQTQSGGEQSGITVKPEPPPNPPPLGSSVLVGPKPITPTTTPAKTFGSSVSTTGGTKGGALFLIKGLAPKIPAILTLLLVASSSIIIAASVSVKPTTPALPTPITHIAHLTPLATPPTLGPTPSPQPTSLPTPTPQPTPTTLQPTPTTFPTPTSRPIPTPTLTPRPIPTPLPTPTPTPRLVHLLPGDHPAAGSSFNGIAAVSATNIWAVGFSHSHTLIEHWNGTQWSIIPSPAPGVISFLTRAVAISATDIWAVGEYNTTGDFNDDQTLVEHWDGTG